jgi:branched-chain amino acid transport system ATP-binding protein
VRFNLSYPGTATSGGCSRREGAGGEQQMVAIGRALMARPRLLCMDEPSLGLSPAYVEQVFDIIRTINWQGVTIFMVEQNANMAF